MSTEKTAIRLAGKLYGLTVAGKLSWADAGKLGPWGERPGQVFKARVEGGPLVQIAEVPVPNSLIKSFYFGVAEGAPEIFEAFAEGYPAEPSEDNQMLLEALRGLYNIARENAHGTQLKVEQFEQLLERLA